MIKFNEFVDLLNEGVYDPGIFKAVFLAGGPGSGKSFIVGKTALTSYGLRIVNSDDQFEAAMKKAGMDMSPENIFSDEGQALRKGAKELTGKRMEMWIKGRLGLVIDGTGKDVSKIQRQRLLLEGLGYETAIIFVNTNVETSLSRNRMRERSLPDAEVSKMWAAVQDNIGKFQSIFRRNFYIVDNSEGSDTEKETIRVYKEIGKWVKKSPRNGVAQGWIRSELEKKNASR